MNTDTPCNLRVTVNTYCAQEDPTQITMCYTNLLSAIHVKVSLNTLNPRTGKEVVKDVTLNHSCLCIVTTRI